MFYNFDDYDKHCRTHWVCTFCQNEFEHDVEQFDSASGEPLCEDCYHEELVFEAEGEVDHGS